MFKHTLKTRKYQIPLWIVFGLLLNATVYAQENIDPQRPTQSESYTIVGKGIAQLEMGMTYTMNNDTGGTFGYGTFIRYGLNRFIELRVSNNFDSYNTIPGIKLILMNDQGYRPGMSFVFSYDILAAQTDFRVAFNQKITNSTGLGINLGRDSQVYAIAIITQSIGNFMGVYAEGYWKEGGQSIYNAGLTLRAHRDIQFDVSAGLLDEEHFYFGLGVSGRIGY